MAVATVAAVVGALAAGASAVKQHETARSAKRQGKAVRKQGVIRQAKEDFQLKDKEKKEDARLQQQLARQKQKGVAADASGRQGTILGGAGAGNSGNQAQSGAGKTLLGV